MGFLHALDRAYDKFTDLMGDATDAIPGQVDDKAVNTLGTATKLVAGFTPGLVLDAARAIPYTDIAEGKHWDAISTKDSLARASDLLVGEGTLTGWSIRKTGEVLDAGYRNIVENPLESLSYMAFDQTSWSRGWELATKGGIKGGNRTLGQTINLHLTDMYDSLGIGSLGSGWGPSESDSGVDSDTLDAWEKTVAKSPEMKYVAGAFDIGAMFAGDPAYLGLKGATKANSAYRAGNTMFGTRWREGQWDKLFGKLDDTGEIDAKINAAGEPVEALPVKNYTPGKLDEWKSEAEVQAGLKLGRENYAGPVIARALYATNKIDDAATRINARRAIASFIHGDPHALGELKELSPSTWRDFSNMVQGRSDAGVFEAAASDADHAAELLDGTMLPTHLTPEVAADTDDALESSDAFKRLYASMQGDTTVRATASGNRAVARARQQGLARDGQLNTGFDVVDTRVTLPKPVSRIFMAESPFAVGAQVVKGGFKSIDWNDALKDAAAWSVGVAPVAKTLTKLSSSLRDTRVYGSLNVEDAQLSVAVANHIARASDMDAAKAQKYISQVVHAPSPAHRAVAIEAMQKAAIATLAERHGTDPATALRVAEGGFNYVKGMSTAADSQRFAATRSTFDHPSAPLDEGGRLRYADQSVKKVVLPGDQGAIVMLDDERHPITVAQTINSVHIIDIERANKWLKRDHFLRAIGNHVKNHTPKVETTAALGPDGAPLASATRQPLRQRFANWSSNGGLLELSEGDSVQAIAASAESLNSFWKRSVLLTRSGSYAIRNTLEEQLRVWALSRGSVVAMEREKQRPYLTRTGKQKAIPDELGTAIHAQRAQIKMLEDQINDPALAEKIAAHEARTDNPPLNQEIADHYALADELAAAREELNGLLTQADEFRPFAGSYETTLPDGTTVTLPEAEAGQEGRTFRDLVNSDASGFDIADRDAPYRALALRAHRLMADNNPHIPSPYLADATPENVANYFDEWDHILNFQLASDAAGKVALQAKVDGLSGEALAAHMEDWLASPAAATYRTQNPVYRGDLETWAHDLQDFTEAYVPTRELAERLLAPTATPASELRKMFDGQWENLPEALHRARGSMLMGTKGAAVQQTVTGMFKSLDRMSLQKWTRHPMFSAYYREANDRRVAAWYDRVKAERGDDATISMDEINEIASESRKEALHNIKQTFYDASIRSSAAHQLRFIYPFFAAHQDSVRFWGKTFTTNPAQLRKLQIGFQAPSNLGVVVDQHGEIKPQGAAVDPLHDRVATQLPSFLGGSMDLNISSAMLMLQSGSILNPGAGPMVGIPVAYFQKHLASSDAEWERVAKFFSPWGAPKNEGITQALATPVNRALELYEAQWSKDGDGYIHLLNTRLQDAYVDYRNENDGKMPSEAAWDKIVKAESAKVRHGAWMRLAASFASPIQPTPVSAHEAIRAEYLKLQDKYRDQPDGWIAATDEFLKKYGDASYAITQSQTESRAHLPPTVQALATLKANRALTNKVRPETWGLIVGGTGDAGQFSTNAYRAIQEVAFNNKGEKASAPLTPEELHVKVSVGEGWLAYNKRLKTLQQDSIDRGYALPEDDPLFTEAKKAMTDQIGADNPIWLEHRFDSKVHFKDLLDDAEVIANSKSLLKDPARGDIRWLKAYVDAHRQVEQILANRAAAGVKGGGSIDSEVNLPLKVAFSRYVAGLRESNIEFSDHAFPSLVYKDPYYDEDILGVKDNG